MEVRFLLLGLIRTAPKCYGFPLFVGPGTRRSVEALRRGAPVERAGVPGSNGPLPPKTPELSPTLAADPELAKLMQEQEALEKLWGDLETVRKLKESLESARSIPWTPAPDTGPDAGGKSGFPPARPEHLQAASY